MTEAPLDLTDCDREPIHIPGSIQPHGVLLVADATSLAVRHIAGDPTRLPGAPTVAGAPIGRFIGERLAELAVAVQPGAAGLYLGQIEIASGALDASAHRTGDTLLIDIEPATDERSSASSILAELETATTALREADTLRTLYDLAAREFARITCFDRVMLYRFLPDDTGRVEAESVKPGLQSFLHHHFPASDIPVQARALYVRNLVRVIPDVDYRPQPLLPTPEGDIDLSDSGLRSVSPIHLQYLRNMGIRASASVSIVVDGRLWGLVACHNLTPLGITYDRRSACRALAATLAQQIKAKEELDAYREQIRLGGFASNLVSVLSRDGPLADALANHIDDIRRMLNGDGVAVVREGELITAGSVPPKDAIHTIARWIVGRGTRPVFATDCLGTAFPDAAPYSTEASGVLAAILAPELPWMILWFRAEEIQVVDWAGNPHKDDASPGAMLTPRASFAAWSETVRGRARTGSAPEVEAARRMRTAVLEERQNWRVRDLNRQLTAILRDKDLLIAQKQYLVGEVNHRVQNSLQLVSSFLGLQRRSSDDPQLQTALDEAVRRINSVAVLHRRLYRGDSVEQVDLSRYLEDLAHDALTAAGDGWADQFDIDLAPVSVATDSAIPLGLIVTELIINANKYAYGGRPGPLVIRLAQRPGAFQLSVADRGSGRVSARKGFGSRMIDIMVSQLGATLAYEDNAPGLRATVTMPLKTTTD